MSAENPPNNIVEILKGFLGKYQKPLSSQSQVNLSPLRIKSLKLSQRIISRADKYTKDNILKKVFMPFVKKHINNLITNVIPEEELKQVLWESFDDIDELKKEMDMVYELKNSPTDNTIHTEVMKLPRFKELADLL